MPDSTNSSAFPVPAESAGFRIGRFLGDVFPLDPEDLVRTLLADGKVVVNGAPAAPDRTVRAGETVIVRDFEATRSALRVDAAAPGLLYEDDHIVVLDKPAGCTVTRERNARGCPFQVGALRLIRASDKAAGIVARRYRPRPVHRLDRETTGVIILAISREGELHLARQFRERTVQKEYLAVVHGELPDESGEMLEAIAADPRDIGRMKIDDRHGRPSATRYEVAERFRSFTRLRVWPRTGRRHQIRVHLSGMGFPVVADTTYEGLLPMLSGIKRGYRHKRGQQERPLLARPALHAHAVTFLPVAGDTPLRVEAPEPTDIALLLKMLRKYARGGASPLA